MTADTVAMARRLMIAFALLTLLAAGCSASPTSPSPTAVPSSAVASPDVSYPPVLGEGTYVARSKTASLMVDRHPFTSARVEWSFPAKNAFGQQVSFLVTGSHRMPAGTPWLHIQLGVKPNEATAWVPEDEVTVRRVRESVVVDLSQRTLNLYRDGRSVERFTVGVGQPQWPTTPGRYFVWAKVPQASPFGPYGVYALGLSGFSTVLTDWPGGGRMAIHGTSDPSDRGQQVSHGCIRVYNPDMQKLKHLPMGTPVVIQK
jgi:lipoprotein-anchoring transpeptidase ErfK/SrfK